MNLQLAYLALLIIILLLIALVLRLFLPQLIYDLRRAFALVDAKKSIFESRVQTKTNSSKVFRNALVNDIRYDAPYSDERYIKNRVLKIKELYSALDPKRTTPINTDGKKMQVQVCIIELANMLETIGQNLSPNDDFIYSIIDSNSILTFIANEVSKKENASIEKSKNENADVNGFIPRDKFISIPTNLSDPHEKDSAISKWYETHPISLEQAIEILCAAAHSLACRLEKTKNYDQ
jgi:hypothetical protein